MYVRQHKLLFDSNTVVLISISSLFFFKPRPTSFVCVCPIKREREKKTQQVNQRGNFFFFFSFLFFLFLPFLCVLHPYHVRLLTRLSLFLKGRMSSFFLTELSNVRYTQPLVPVYDSGPFSYFLFFFFPNCVQLVESHTIHQSHE